MGGRALGCRLFFQRSSSALSLDYRRLLFLDLVARDDQGKAYTVRYEAVNAMLLNEFLQEHQQKQIETLTAGLQKVSAQVEMSKPASQMVLNNQ